MQIKKHIYKVLNIFLLFMLGVFSFFTQELVTFIMLGFVLIMLSNIYDKLDDLYKRIDHK